jgi:hypothetical protein
VFGETTAGPIVGINGNEGAVFWQKLSAPRITSTSIDIPRLFETDSHLSLVSSSSSSSLSLVSSSSSTSSLNLEFTLGGAATFDPKRKVFWVTNYETKSKSVMLWKIDLDANTSSNVPISSFHGQTGFFSVPVFDGDRYLYITSTTIFQDEPSTGGKEGREVTTEQRQEGDEDEEEKKKQKKDEESKHSRLVRIDVETLEYQNLTPPKVWNPLLLPSFPLILNTLFLTLLLLLLSLSN